MDSLRARDRKILIAGAAACAVILAVGRGTPRLREWYIDARANAAEAAEMLASARAAIKAPPVLTDSLRRRAHALDSLADRLFVAPSRNGMLAEASKYLTQTAKQANIEMGTLQISTDSSNTRDIQRLTATASARGDIRGLMAFLAKLESGPKLFRVTALSVSQPDLVGTANSAEALTLQLSVQTLAWDRAGR